jgi:hypothetical protein
MGESRFLCVDESNAESRDFFSLSFTEKMGVPPEAKLQVILWKQFHFRGRAFATRSFLFVPHKKGAQTMAQSLTRIPPLTIKPSPFINL